MKQYCARSDVLDGERGGWSEIIKAVECGFATRRGLRRARSACSEARETLLAQGPGACRIVCHTRRGSTGGFGDQGRGCTGWLGASFLVDDDQGYPACSARPACRPGHA